MCAKSEVCGVQEKAFGGKGSNHKQLFDKTISFGCKNCAILHAHVLTFIFNAISFLFANKISDNRPPHNSKHNFKGFLSLSRLRKPCKNF